MGSQNKSFLVVIMLGSFVLSLGTSAPSPALFAAEIQGAATAIDRIKSVIDSGKETANPTTDERNTLMRDMEQFEKTKGSMSKGEAAMQWVHLAERFLQLPHMDPRQIEAKDLEEFKLLLKTTTVKSLFEILPGPESWPEIATLCEEKINTGNDAPAGLRSLLIFINLLNHNVDQVLSDLESFETSALEQDTYSKEQIRLWFSQIKDEIKKHEPTNKSSGVVEAFELVLSSFESFATQPAIVRAPDLLKETDRDRATKLLKRALHSPTIYLEIPSGQETRKLGIEVALAEIDALKRTQWGLVHSIETTELFEKLYEKFVRSKINPDQNYAQMVTSQAQAIPFEGENDLKKRAISYYVLGLLSENRINEAIDFTLSLENELISASEFESSLEATERVDLFPIYTDFLDTILKNNPELPFWKQYIKIALTSHRTDILQNTLISILKREEIDFLLKQNIRKHFITVLLAQDKIDEALKIFAEIESTEPLGEGRKNRQEFADLLFDLGRDFYALGKVLERKDIEDRGSLMALKAFQDKLDNEDPGSGLSSTYELGKFVAILIERKDFSSAEQLIIESTLNQIDKAQKGARYSTEMIHFALSGTFAELAKLYGKSGQHREVITLLNLSPWWNAEDLSDLHDQELFLVVAKALHEVGESDRAITILKSYLLEKSNDDEAYQLLVEIAGNDIMPWLEELYRMDRFEERPLMWKAYLLYKDEQYDLAEKAIRQAMNVDPTDGEQEAGQRVHSYSLLADILEAKGDKESAAFFRDVVKSVRIAEQGDLFSKAGLVTRSIDFYQEAMAVFADAYCIQWRLAERLYATGDLEGSKEHYRIAFERMPEQFGQVASFCFGCEGAFDKIQSRSAAEEVFSHLLETSPARPQVYFLYGLLRKSQKRIPEAYSYFKKAVELDQDYLDAWKEISKLSDSVYLSREEKDQIVIKMLSLDSQQKHFSANLSDVVDWANLWRTLANNQGIVMKQPKTLYPLPESAKLLEEKMGTEAQDTSAEYFYGLMNRYFNNNSKTLSPSELLSQHGMVSTLDYFISLEKQQ